MANPVIRVPVSSLKVGDTIVRDDGTWRTLGKGNIGRCAFMGASVLGDVRGLHDRTIPVVLFPNWVNGERQGYVRQR